MWRRVRSHKAEKGPGRADRHRRNDSRDYYSATKLRAGLATGSAKLPVLPTVFHMLFPRCGSTSLLGFVWGVGRSQSVSVHGVLLMAGHVGQKQLRGEAFDYILLISKCDCLQSLPQEFSPTMPSATSTSLDIIVIGAGLGGLAAAISCALGGHNVTVLEQARELAEVRVPTNAIADRGTHC